MSTINNLSPELLSHIFTYCVEKKDGHFIVPSPKTAPLLLLQVCRLWALVVMGTSELWDSVSLSRHVRPPYGYDFIRDGDGLAAWISRANVRHVAVELCYDELGPCGAFLMWNDLIVMVLELLHPQIKCNRLHLNLPDDCMEKIFWKLETYKVSCSETRALSVKSSPVEACRKRYRWWTGVVDPDVDGPRKYRMDFNLSKFPALEELTMDFPAPYSILDLAQNLSKLDITIYYWSIFDNCIDMMPNLVDVRVVLKSVLCIDPLQADEYSRVARNVCKLEVCSGLGGDFGATVLGRFFLAFHFPQLQNFALRCVDQPFSLESMPSIAMPLLHFFRNHGAVEDFVLDGFPMPETEANRFEELFLLLPKVQHVELRNEAYNLLPCTAAALQSPVCPELCSLKINTNVADSEMSSSVTRFAYMLLSRRHEYSGFASNESDNPQTKVVNRLKFLELTDNLVDQLYRMGYGEVLQRDGLQVVNI